MRKTWCVFIIALLVHLCPSQAETFRKSLPFTGKLNRSTPFILQDGSGLKEALNMIRPSPGVPAGWKSRSGVSPHNSTAMESGAQVESLHQYNNSDIGTDCLIAQINDKLYLANSFPPTGGSTFGSSILDLNAGAGPIFSAKVGDDWVGAASGETPFAWSGGTAYPDSFLIDRTSGNTNYHNGFEFVRDNETSTNITFIQSNAETFYFGYRRRLDGISLDFVSGTVNSVVSGLSVFAIRSGAWTEVSGLSDGTATDAGGGDKPFGQSGAITWTRSTEDTHYTLPGTTNDLFWYKITVSADITDGIKVYRAQVMEDIERITNLWSGKYDLAIAVLKSSLTGYENWTVETTDNTDADYLDLHGLTTSYAVYLGFAFKAQGIWIGMVPDSINTVASGLTVEYWDSETQSFTDSGVSALVDGTEGDVSNSLHHSGIVQWDGTSATEDRSVFGDVPVPLYWYKLSWSADFSAVTPQIWDIAQIQKPESIPSFPQYEGVINHNGRCLFWPGDQHRSGFDYTAFEYPHIFNGADAGSTENIADPGTVNAAASLHDYTVFSTKEPYKTWILQGKVPPKFDALCISHTVGCLAPHTMITVEDNVRIFNQDRNAHVVVFLSHSGVYMTDGMTVINISQPIADLFDQAEAPYIDLDNAEDSWAWVDYREKTVHFAVPISTTKGTAQTTNNYELVYNYIASEWYDRHSRAAPASCGLDVIDDDNKRIPYIGGYNGKVYMCDSGVTDDDGTAINHYVVTSDFAPFSGQIQDALHFRANLRGVKLKGKAQPEGNVVVTVYPDNKTTGIGFGHDISMFKDGYGYFQQKLTRNLYGELFSFKFEAGSSSAEVMEIYGYTVDYQPIRETQ